METLKVYTPNQIKEIENIAINEFDIPSSVLMEHAALSVLDFLTRKFNNRRVLLFPGPGKNGGDTLALARLLYSNKWDLFLYHKSHSYLPTFSDINVIKENDIIIDGLFGTGLNREISGEYGKIITEINRLKAIVVSLDLPSGICGESGAIVGSLAVKADYTITFCGEKVGLFNTPASDYCGKIISTKINIPDDVFSRVESSIYINSSSLLPIRDRNAHKTTYGRVLIVAGSQNYFGAPLFATKASIISGSGYTTLLSTKEVIESVSKSVPEAVYKTPGELGTTLEVADFVLYGPGLGTSRPVSLKEILEKENKQILVDGDGLLELIENRELFKNYSGEKVITPHPGEASRLLNISTKEINIDRVKAARMLTEMYNTNVVLKGLYTVISLTDGNCYINKSASQALATAGSGDILAGIIAGISRYGNFHNAIRSSVLIHSKMGKIGESRFKTNILGASELMECLREATLPEQP